MYCRYAVPQGITPIKFWGIDEKKALSTYYSMKMNHQTDMLAIRFGGDILQHRNSRLNHERLQFCSRDFQLLSAATGSLDEWRRKTPGGERHAITERRKANRTAELSWMLLLAGYREMQLLSAAAGWLQQLTKAEYRRCQVDGNRIAEGKQDSRGAVDGTVGATPWAKSLWK